MSMPENSHVWYIELRGEEAVGVLSGVLERLPGLPGFQGAELLTSPAQPGLALIASRWAGEVPDLPLPAGAKHWAFEVIAAALPSSAVP